MRRVIKQLLVPRNSHEQTLGPSEQALAPLAWLPLPSASDGLFSRESWDRTVNRWNLMLSLQPEEQREQQHWPQQPRYQ